MINFPKEHNNLKESIRKLFEKPDMLISLKTQLIYSLDVCELSSRTNFYWHQFDMEERNSTLFTFNVNDRQLYVNEFVSNSENIKLAKFEFNEDDTDDGASNSTSSAAQTSPLTQQFPQIKLLHSQFYNDKAISMLFSYKKERQTANCFVQFPIQSLLSRLEVSKIQKRITIDPTLPAVNLRNLIDLELVRALDINDGNSLAVSGGRKIATIISASRKKFYHFEMEVDEDDDEDDTENEGTDNENEENNDSIVE